ncbi:polysaccharide deacetylase family protein [Streptomyces cyaneofuscatus]|uniref:Polysaccharide deacetylase family protein n=1 Tax=Streptomyces cyaneofuscatus TaxID=66883 RepID=A0ABZ1F403_9ACTN|nr:polysaccharide deacetylase family protein [Streptomyces cyaneofuscatus]WSB11071.1 polysaccharide deacetylase family protein [Streptomyces cyaneofuscatus]WSD45396.1 polysaccharide deacetylase family protein [Streptomyces cyaneofuscatus]
MTALTVMGVLFGGALAGCGGAAAPAPAAPATASPAPTSPSAPALAAATSATPKKPPTMAPGPAGRTPVFERRPTGGSAAEKAAAEKVVALTFDADMTADQGPRAKAGERFDNPELIALLRRLKVPSTVFMTGRWAEEYPAQAKRIGTDDLFEVANHSYSHHAFTADCYGLPVVAKDSMTRDVERAFSAFRQAGVRNVVPYFRFPGGCYDDAALRALGPADVTAVQWDVVSGDAFATDAGAVAEQVLDGVRPGSLVVMHCTRSAAPVTAEAIGRIVPELRKRGYRFVKVSELMEE